MDMRTIVAWGFQRQSRVVTHNLMQFAVMSSHHAVASYAKLLVRLGSDHMKKMHGVCGARPVATKLTGRDTITAVTACIRRIV